nr:GntR family transcriptional regulator [Pseudomonas psychrophila]
MDIEIHFQRVESQSGTLEHSCLLHKHTKSQWPPKSTVTFYIHPHHQSKHRPRQKFRSGAWLPSKLPSVSELLSMPGVSRMTINRALCHLTTERVEHCKNRSLHPLPGLGPDRLYPMKLHTLKERLPRWFTPAFQCKSKETGNRKQETSKTQKTGYFAKNQQKTGGSNGGLDRFNE